MSESTRAKIAGERVVAMRSGLALCIGFVVPTIAPMLAWLGLLHGAKLDDLAEGHTPPLGTIVLVTTLAEILGIAGIFLCIGRDAVRNALAACRAGSAWAAAPLIAAAAFGVSYGWVWVVDRASDFQRGDLDGSTSTTMWLEAVVLAPVLEELLCRGALWEATRRIVGRSQTVLVTSTVFALLHLQNGGLMLELPHRFLAGLFLGWLRLHGRSIWPCVLAHAMLNTAALAVSG